MYYRISLKAVVGVLYTIIGGLNINKHRDHRAAVILNDAILIGVFFISMINVIISGFGMEYTNGPLQAYASYQEWVAEKGVIVRDYY